MFRLLSTGRVCLCPKNLPLGNDSRAFQAASSLLRSQARGNAIRAGFRPHARQNHHYSWRSGYSYGSTSKVFLYSAGAGAGALSPAAFVGIMTSQTDEQQSKDDGDASDDSEKTGEELMLERSRAELASTLPNAISNSNKYRRAIYLFLDTWIYEPVCTTLRFLHLVIIFVPVIVTVPMIWVGKRVKERDDERTGTLWWYGFLVKSMERAGAAFIKLGQWAASRSDVFPNEMCMVMSTLHSNAPPHSLEKTKKIIRKAFGGRKFEDIFQEFDETPLGVGAIAQVYKAKLKPDLAMPGDPDIAKAPTLSDNLRKNVDYALKSTPQRVPSSYIAIKVLHPGVDRIVQRDLRIMGFFASLIDLIPTMHWLSFPDEVTQFGEMMKLQLDLRIESANLTLFRKNFANRSTAWFPFPYTDYSAREVLIEEFAHGIPLEDFLTNGGGPFEKEIADEGLDAFLHMLLIDNFTHADLHPGNIMVRFYHATSAEISLLGNRKGLLRNHPHPDQKELDSATDATEEVLSRLRPLRGPAQREEWNAELQALDSEGYRPQIIFIDTGLVTQLNASNRKNFLDLFKAVAEFDGYRAGQLMVERCRQPEEVLEPEVFALRMQHLVLGVKSRTFALGNIKVGDILDEVLSMVRKHHVRLEGDFVNVVLSILLLEGIGRKLDPDLDLFAGALPIMRQLGTQSGSSLITGGDFSMLKVWAGLEARSFLQASIEDVERCVKYDLLAPNV